MPAMTAGNRTPEEIIKAMEPKDLVKMALEQFQDLHKVSKDFQMQQCIIIFLYL